MSRHYEAFESQRGGYAYVDLREEDGGTTVLGADGEGGYKIAEAEKIAGLLNDALAAEPGHGRIDVTAEQAEYLRSLLRAASANNTLEYEGGDLSEEAFEALCSQVEQAVGEAASPSYPSP